MAVPDFQSFMLPVLREAAEGRGRVSSAIVRMSDVFGLTEAERADLLGSGRQTRLANRVNWAFTYLNKAGLIERLGRGEYRATDSGRAVLMNPPPKITIGFLQDISPAFREFREVAAASESTTPTAPSEASTDQTPEERIANAAAELEEALRDELLSRVMAATPAFFERMVMQLMRAMGYGVAAEHLGGSGDGGVDAVIFEDRLGLDLIYIQAKRYAADRAVGAEEVRGFSGALDDRGTRKGVFVTTSRFTPEAKGYAQRQQQKRIVLMDGRTVADLMLRHGIGVRDDRTLVLKRVDPAFFTPEEA